MFKTHFFTVTRKIKVGTAGFKPSPKVDGKYWLFDMTKIVVTKAEDSPKEGDHYGDAAVIDETNCLELVEIDRQLRKRYGDKGIVKAINYAADLWQRGLTDAANKIATGKKAAEAAKMAWMSSLTMDTMQQIVASGMTPGDYYDKVVAVQADEDDQTDDQP